MKNQLKNRCQSITCRNVSIIKAAIAVITFLISSALISQPVVVTQPQDTSVCVESSGGFSIIAVNTSGYQWQENDGIGWYNLDATFTYIEGELTPNLTINDANLALNGYLYRCIVSDINNDKDTSQPATLGVYEPPIFTYEPENQRVCKSDIAIFSVEAINGTDYQWQEYNGVGWLDIENNAFYTGAQTPDLSVYTVTGMDGFSYHCIVKNVSCPDTSGNAMLNVDATPVLYSVTGGGSYCEGELGLSVGLSDSEMGISYNLMLDGEETGVVVEGTGEALDFGLQQLPGTYTVVAYNQFTSCTITMGGEAIIFVKPLPVDIQVMGGGTICMGDDYPEVYLLSSEVGVDYSLYYNAVYTGLTSSGSGYGINFGPQQNAGFYTVLATNTATSCTRQLSGTVEVIITSLPTADAGSDHNIVQGSYAQLQGIASGGTGSYTYQWSPSNQCISPTTANTQTADLYISTIFEFVVTDNNSGCISNPDSSIVYVSSGPLSVQAFTNTNNICSGEDVNLIAVASGGTGNYTYTWTSSPSGFISSSPNPQVTPLVSTLYIVNVTDGLEFVSDTVSVNVFPLPQTYLVSEGGNYCQGGDGVDISLSGSDIGIRYSLYYQQSLIDDKLGTGQGITFNDNIQQGEYSIIARNDNTTCATPQQGVAIIGINELPIAEAGPNVLINAGDFATLSGSAMGGSGNYSYLWSPADSLINPNSSNASTIPLQTTNMFNLTVTDGEGCESIDDNTIVFVSGGDITLDILTSGFPVCPEEEVQLYAMASGGSGSFSYFWQSNPVGYSSTSFNPIINPTATTTYIVTVNDGLNVVTDSITVVVNPSPTEFMLSGGGTVCHGTPSNNIILQGSETGVDYSLTKDGGNTGLTISGSGFALDFGVWNNTGEYSVFAENITTMCDNDMAGVVEVIVNPIPIANAGQDQLITAGSTVILTGNGSGGSGIYDYQWEPSYLCLTPTSQNTSTQPISQTTQFFLSVTDVQTQCTSNSDTTIITTQGSDLYVNVNVSNSSICLGEEITLTAIAGGGTGSYAYSWTSQPVGTYSSNSSFSTYPSVSTFFYIEVYDGLSYAYDTVYVEVNQLPALFQVSGGGSYCDGGDGLNIGLTGSEIGAIYGLYRYPDVFQKEIMGTGQPIDFGSFTQAGTYYSISVLNGNCQETMLGEVEISIDANPIADAGDNQTILYNTQAVLLGDASMGSGNYYYQWSPADSLVVPNVQQPLTQPLQSTTMFNLQVTDNASGCFSQDATTVVFVEGGEFTVQLTSNLPSVCPGEEVQLYALASGGTGNYSFLWTSIPPGFISTEFNPVVTPNISTSYLLSVSDGNSTISDSISIIVNPIPIPYSIGGGGTVCDGNNPANIILQGSEIGIEYQLLRDGLLTGNSQIGDGFAIDFGIWTEPGNYTAHGEIQSTYCSGNMSGVATVSINPLPIANAGSDQLVTVGSNVTLTGNSSGGSGSYYYSWQPTYLCLSPSSQNTLTHPISQTTYFTLKTTDIQSQCQSLPDTCAVTTEGQDLSVIASSSPSTVCYGEQLSLYSIASGGTANYSYSWTSIPTGFYSTNQNTSTIPTVNTLYIIDVFDGISHSFDTTEVVISPLPQIYNIVGGGEYCMGDQGLEIGLSDSEIGVEYILYRIPDIYVAELMGTGSSINFGIVTEAGDYYVKAMSASGCGIQMFGEVSIIINPIPLAYAGEDQIIGFNTQAVLSGSGQGGSGVFQYYWSPEDSLINPNVQNALSVPLQTTNQFELYVVDAQSECESNTSNAVVFVSGGPMSLQLTTSNPVICQGEETQLFALVSGGTGNYSFLWTSDPPGFSSTDYNPIVTPGTSTIYTVSVNDGNTILTDNISITTNSLPIPYNVTGGGSICEGDFSDDITLMNSEVNTSYTLLLDGLSTNIIANGTGFPINFGGQTIGGQYSVYAINNVTQCENSMAGSANVIMYEIPIANAGPDQAIQKNTSTIISGQVEDGSGNYTYNWQPIVLCQTPHNPSTLTNQISQSSMFTFNAIDIQSLCVSEDDTMYVFTTGDELSVTASISSSSICIGEQTNISALPDGGSGNYSFSWTSNPAGFNSSQMNAVIQPTQTTTYYCEVFDGIEYAVDSTFVQVIPNPVVYNIYGGGSYCEGDNGVEIFLDGSDQGVVYRLYHFPDNPIIDVVGTGGVLTFGETTLQGDYYIVANPDHTCTGQMNGTATVTMVSLPIANAGDNQTISWQGQTQLFGSAIGGTGSYLYNWNPSDSLVNPQNKEPLTVPLHTTTLFNLDVIDATTGCLGIDDQTVVYVTGGPLSTTVYSSNTDICEGEETQLFALASGGSGNYTYLWLSEPPGFSSNIYNPVVDPSVSTTYTVIVGDGTTSLNDSIIINVSLSPDQYNLLGGGVFCENGDGLEISLSGSQESSNYELFNNYGSTGIVVPGSGDVISFGIQNVEGYYWATATENTLGCSSIMLDTVQIEESDLPLANSGADQYIEEGNSTILNGDATGGSGFYGYNWYPDYLLIDPTIQNPVTVPLFTSTLYSLVVEDLTANCTSYSDSTIVYITNSELSIDVSATPEVVCEGETVLLSAMPTGGTGNYAYTWYSNPPGLYSNNQFPSDNPTQNTTYIAEIFDGDTLIMDSVFVEVISAPIVFEVVGGGSYCKNGDGVGISLSGSQEGMEYTLIRNQSIEVSTVIGDGSSVDFGIFKIDGNYIVHAGNAQTGCYQQMAGSVTVSQHPQPIADAGSDIIVPSGSNATLDGSAFGGSGEYDYLWSPSEKLINPGDPDATTIPLMETTLFTLLVTDELTNCISDPSNMIVLIQGGPIMVDILAANNQVCPGHQVSLYALPGGGNGNYSYFWESIPAGYNATAQEVNVTPGVDTWYKVTITDGDQVISDSILISTYSVPESFDLLGGGGYCAGGGGVEIFLESSNESIIYTLYHNTTSTGNYVVGSGSQISFGNVLTTGIYSVLAENNYGCSSTMNNVVQVAINPLPEKYSLYGGGTYCENDPTLGLLLESSQENVEYELYKDGNPTGITEQGSGLPIGFVGFDGTGLYSVVATGIESGCVNTMLGVSGLIINDIPNINISGPDSICSGESVTLSGTGGYTYEWNTVPPQYTPSIVITPEITTNYTLIGYNQIGCYDSANHSVEVSIAPNITLYNDQISMTVIVQPDNLSLYEFYLNETLVQTGPDNSWYYGDMGLLSDSLLVVGYTESLCTDTEMTFVELKESPNAFTPNGDGKNDLFLEGHDIIVYSSWGGEIYKGDKGWDGKFNGSLVTPGTYYYVQNVYNVSGELLKTIKGSVTVVID